MIECRSVVPEDSMPEAIVTILNPLGLHARAAAKLVKCANRFRSNIGLERLDTRTTADAKSILGVLLLAATRGTRLRLTASGDDEGSALAAVSAIIATGFGEMDFAPCTERATASGELGETPWERRSDEDNEE